MEKLITWDHIIKAERKGQYKFDVIDMHRVITWEEVRQAEKTKQYQFPFKESHDAECVMNFNKTYSEYINNEENHYAMEYMGKKHKYTINELESHWKTILINRFALLAALKVVNGEFIGINPALLYFKKYFKMLDVSILGEE